MALELPWLMPKLQSPIVVECSAGGTKWWSRLQHVYLPFKLSQGASSSGQVGVDHGAFVVDLSADGPPQPCLLAFQVLSVASLPLLFRLSGIPGHFLLQCSLTCPECLIIMEEIGRPSESAAHCMRNSDSFPPCPTPHTACSDWG